MSPQGLSWRWSPEFYPYVAARALLVWLPEFYPYVATGAVFVSGDAFFYEHVTRPGVFWWYLDSLISTNM